MNREDFEKSFWLYYLNLEERFLNTTKYVAVDSNNYQTYSIEYISLLLGICSEIDVILKEICGFNQDDSKNINDYFIKIVSKFPNIFQETVICPFSSIKLTPFSNWSSSTSPDWWQNYNKVKHGRLDNFTAGNLKNVLNALAALFTLERYQLKDIADTSQNKNEVDIPNEDSKIFGLTNLTCKCIRLNTAIAFS